MHSYRNRVLFTAATMRVPKDAILVEVGPHAILRSPLRQSRPGMPYVGLMRKGECGLASLSAAVGELWRRGAAVHWAADEVPSGVKGAERGLLLQFTLPSRAKSACSLCSRSLTLHRCSAASLLEIHYCLALKTPLAKQNRKRPNSVFWLSHGLM